MTQGKKKSKASWTKSTKVTIQPSHETKI